jgi:hypothetical protein
MPRIEITHETDWAAEYVVHEDGDVTLTDCTVDGEHIPWTLVPRTVDNLLVDAAREAEAQSRRDSAAEQADLKILRRKEGERGNG